MDGRVHLRHRFLNGLAPRRFQARWGTRTAWYCQHHWHADCGLWRTAVGAGSAPEKSCLGLQTFAYLHALFLGESQERHDVAMHAADRSQHLHANTPVRTTSFVRKIRRHRRNGAGRSGTNWRSVQVQFAACQSNRTRVGHKLEGLRAVGRDSAWAEKPIAYV
eukprot:scaffold43699_cov183-Amphora_coffeaeformis.AAC.2